MIHKMFVTSHSLEEKYNKKTKRTIMIHSVLNNSDSVYLNPNSIIVHHIIGPVKYPVFGGCVSCFRLPTALTKILFSDYLPFFQKRFLDIFF